MAVRLTNPMRLKCVVVIQDTYRVLFCTCCQGQNCQNPYKIGKTLTLLEDVSDDCVEDDDDVALFKDGDYN